MKVIAQDTFFKSLKKLINSRRWWRWEFYENKYFEFKWRFWAFKNYNNVITKNARPWDSEVVLIFMKKHFENIAKCLENGHEIEETRTLRIKDIKRCIEIIENILKGDYSERCGFDHERNNLQFVQVEGCEEQYELVYADESQTEEERCEILKKARELEMEEWEELWETLKKGKFSDAGMNGWWD